MIKRLYFGHPINVYNTELETRLLEKIKTEFPDWEIENPGLPHHNDGYKEYQERTGRGMNYFFEAVLPKCHGGIFLPFRDGAWGKGVFGEAEFLSKNKFPIWEITTEGEIFSEINLELVKVLTVEETRARIRTVSGEIMPY